MAILLGQVRDLEHDLSPQAAQRLASENTTLKHRVRGLTSDNKTLEERVTSRPLQQPLRRTGASPSSKPSSPNAHQPADMTGPGDADPLGTIPLFDVKIPLTPARATAIRRALAALDAIRARRRELDRHEHQLITQARTAGVIGSDRRPPRLQGPASRPATPPGAHPHARRRPARLADASVTSRQAPTSDSRHTHARDVKAQVNRQVNSPHRSEKSTRPTCSPTTSSRRSGC